MSHEQLLFVAMCLAAAMGLTLLAMIEEEK